jgi:hypothetical protein
MSSDESSVSARVLDPAALASSLGPELKRQTAEAATAFLRFYLEEGLSARAAAREAGVSEQLSLRWLEILKLKRDRSEIHALQRQILDAARRKFTEDRLNVRSIKRAVTA